MPNSLNDLEDEAEFDPDPAPICSPPLTAADRREMSAFFARLRAQNDQDPAVLAIRAEYARRALTEPPAVPKPPRPRRK